VNERRRRLALVGRYWLFQLPGMFVAGVALVLLVHWTQLTPTQAAVLFGLWVLKDLVMFPVTRIAYETRASSPGADGVRGAEGFAQGEIDASGSAYVRVGAELWRARVAPGAEPLPKGSRVRVLELRDLTLLVERAEP